MRKVIPLLLLLGVSLQVAAQQPKDIMKEPIPVLMFQVSYGFQLPALDTRKQYGFNHSLGGSIVYKTESNWLMTANGNFIFGNKMNQDRITIFGEGITTVDGEITGGSGSYSLFLVTQRGFHLQAEIGRLFPFGPNPNCGFFVQAGLGYLRQRTHIDFPYDEQNTPHVVFKDYEYGYDRMRGGPAFHLESGYLFLSDTRMLNVSVSFEVTYARTRELRDYDFRVFTNPETGVMEPVGYTDPKKRYNDLYYGIRVTWNVPTYQRQPDEFYYN